MPKDARDRFTVPLAFVGVDETKIEFANIFGVQINDDTLTLVVGQMTPPLLVGSPEEKREAARAIPFAPIRVLARFGITRGKAADLAKLIQDQLARAEAGAGDSDAN